jgi:signal transduction histidine kinase
MRQVNPMKLIQNINTHNSLSALLLGVISIILLILVLSYTLWARENYLRALETSFNIHMLKAQELINTEGFDTIKPGLAIIDARLIRQYQQLPDTIKQHFSKTELEVGQYFYFEKQATEGSATHTHYFIYTADYKDEGHYYLLQEYVESDAPSLWDMADDELQQIWIVSLIVTVLLVLLMFGIFRFLAKPLYRLNVWSKQLSSADLHRPVPSFDYRELDQLAQQILRSLRAVDETAQRETQFLQYASHELRTPIAVIKSNAELLELLWIDAPKSSLLPLQRIIRAGKTMHHLTETLLWLTRKEMSVPKPITFRLDILILTLIEEHKYLLNGKDVSLKIELDESMVYLPETLIRILMANLIRNAMQHLDEGQVSIRLTDLTFTIQNEGVLLNEAATDEQPVDSFGLGLKLVDQICQQQSWHFDLSLLPNCYIAQLDLKGMS